MTVKQRSDLLLKSMHMMQTVQLHKPDAYTALSVLKSDWW